MLLNYKGSVHGGLEKKDKRGRLPCRSLEILFASPVRTVAERTTLFRLILGSLPLSDGHIFIDGTDIQTLSPKERANLIAYIPQYHTPIFPYTALEGRDHADGLPIFPHLKCRKSIETVRGSLPCAGKSQCTASCQSSLYFRIGGQRGSLFLIARQSASLQNTDHGRTCRQSRLCKPTNA